MLLSLLMLFMSLLSLLFLLLLCWLFCHTVAFVYAVFVVLVLYVDAACMLVVVVFTQINSNFINILFIDSSKCSKDKLTEANNGKFRFICFPLLTGNPTTYKDGDVSFYFTTDNSGSGIGFLFTYKLIDKSSKYDQ
jgi:uncharacterized membrane protein YhdT